MNDRTGFKVEAKQDRKADKWVQNLRNSSFFNVAPQLFNALPLELRSFELPATPTKQNVDDFKKKLDEWLWCIPDQPGSVQGNTRIADTNSILDQKQYYQQRAQEEPGDNGGERGGGGV